MRIGDRPIGLDYPALIVAEISANHNQDLGLARETVAAAAEAGADAIKLQTYTPDTITFPSDAPPFRIHESSAWSGRTLYDIYREGQTPWEWHAELFDYAKSLGMLAFSSPFDPTAVDFLTELDVPAYKIASFEIADIPLIEKCAEVGRPMIISTGIALLDDIEKAIAACRRAGNDQIVILKCTSAYPAPIDELNLRTMADIRERFGVEVGISDHTMTQTACVAAIALGARVVERHIILSKEIESLDSTFSTDAQEFAALVSAIRETEIALGEISYELTPEAVLNRRFGRSLFVVSDVSVGEEVTLQNVRSIRPADGLPPEQLPEVLGQKFRLDVGAGTALTLDLLQ